MTVNASTNLGLALPDQGEWDGTWGTNLNQQITELIDSAVAGTTTLSADADATLSDTNFVANECVLGSGVSSVLFGMVVSGSIRIMYDLYNMVTRADFASGELQFRATYYTS